MIHIVIGTTAIKVKLGVIPKYVSIIRDFTRSYLVELDWDHKECKYVVTNTYVHYNMGTTEVYMPINFLDKLLEYIKRYGVEYNCTHCDVNDAGTFDLIMKDFIKPRVEQEYVLKTIPTTGGGRFGIELQPGKGKTLLALMLVARCEVPALVLVPGKDLTQQWYASALKHTEIFEDDIFIIRGFNSIKKVFTLKNKPKLFIASTSTVSKYVSHGGRYTDVPTFHEFLELFGIGMTIIDEAHLNFAMSTKIDMVAFNINWCIYLTATFIVNHRDRLKIFNTVYPEDMRIAYEYDKYVHGVICKYYTGTLDKYVKSQRGYDQFKFEKRLQKRVRAFNKLVGALIEVLRYKFIPSVGGNKCLIWCGTVKFIDVIVGRLRSVFPKLNIIKYTSAESEELLLDPSVDIIVSTFKSTGTGTDIPNLIMAVNLISMGAKGLTEQIKGRLRARDDVDVTFVDMYDVGLSRHRKHMETRSAIITNTCKTVEYLDYTML